ncbi:MAG: DUF2142 domain-containing protein [Clostridiales bacterium]|nr:DUF2142 domain-containing protein [Clostridiales bacterium]
MKFFAGIPIERLTLFAVLAVGAFYLFVFPPNSAPDEAVHFAAAYQNVGTALGETSDDVKSVAIRAADEKMITDYSRFPDRHTVKFFGEELWKPLPPGGAEIIDVERVSGVPHPYIYFPQTAGMLLGRAFQVNPEWLYMLGRIFNLIFYAICVWMAVRLTPIGKGVFAIVALYPMAMELAASLNSDVYSTALAMLALAQYLRIAYSDSPARLQDLLLMLLTMALLGPPKVVFIPMMMLAFFLPARCFAEKAAAIRYRILVVAVLAATTFIALYVYMHRADGGVPVVTFLDQEVYTIEMLLADPFLFARMCKRTVDMFFEFYLHSMIGSDLGWLEIRINKGVIQAFLALSVIGAFKASASEKSLMLRDRIQFPIIFILAALGTAIIMFVSWTPIGSWNIIGIQGRYFLPAWPLFLLFAARWPKPVRPTWLSDKLLVLAACGLNIYVLVSVYAFISTRGVVTL